MTKKIKTLSIAGVMTILGIGIFVGYNQRLQTQQTVKVQEFVEPVCRLEEIKRIEYKANDLIILENQLGKWANTELTHLVYDQQLMQDWLMKVQELETKEVIKNIPDQSVYGINEDSVEIRLYDGVGNVQTIKLGDIIESEDSMYIQMGSEEDLYVVSYNLAKGLLTRLNNFVECTEVLKIPELQSIKVEYKNETMTMLKDNVWSLEDYYAIPVVLKEDRIKDFINTINAMKVVNYIGTYEDVHAYGLDSPRLILTLNDEMQIAFGSQSGDSIYVSINGGQDVYTINKEVYTNLTNFKPFDAMERQVIHLNMDEIKEMTLMNPQGTYILSFNELKDGEILKSEKTKEVSNTSSDQSVDNVNGKTSETTINHMKNNESETGGDSANNIAQETAIDDKQDVNEEIQVEPIVALLNEKELTQSAAEEWFDKIKESLWIEAPLQNPSIEQKQERKAEATVRFLLKDGSEIVAELVPYDINYYILRYNGIVEFAVSKEKVTRLFNEITYFVKV